MQKLIALLLLLVISYFVKLPAPLKDVVTISPTPSPTPAVLGETVQTLTSTVTRVIDGDTIEITGGKKVRYIGIDTPEIRKECFSNKSLAKNRELVEGREVLLEKDVSETDRYGRLLRYVYIPKEDKLASGEAVFVNDFLVRQGYATAATFPPDVKYQDELQAAHVEARKHMRGLWKECQ